MATRTLAPLIQAGQVTLVHGFAGAHPRQATLARAGSGGSNELILADGASSPADQLIPVITVQHIIEDQKLTSIDLLKCDIEGSEAELFSDCAAWIGRVRWIVVELHNDLNDAWLVEQLQKNGAAFSVKQSEPKSAGCSVAWLRRNE
jgi:FkbM family methyltransferase